VHLRIGQPEMAEDLGILLAELRGDSAHRHALAALDRDADVWDLAQLRVARLLNEAAVADLRVGEPLRVIINRIAGHTGGFEHLDPPLVVLVVSTAFITCSSASRSAMRA